MSGDSDDRGETFRGTTIEGNLRVDKYSDSREMLTLIRCPICGYEFNKSERRWRHLEKHSPEEAGLSPIGERKEGKSLFDTTFEDTGRTLEEWGQVLDVIIDESGYDADISVNGALLQVQLEDDLSEIDRETLVDRVENAGFEIEEQSSGQDLQVSRPEEGLQPPYRETMGPTGERILGDS